ncbi:fibrinogen beta chain-like [Littorina saxatilis]|uniref:fibrinogen beta chain-like n=1 Tax=Littorina saxatilis TaxID=31220 RepID=UPI0038B4D3B7
MRSSALWVLCCTVAICSSVSTSSDVRKQDYGRCPISSKTIGQGPNTVIGSSSLQCAMECSKTEQCQSVAVCHGDDPGHVLCELRNDITQAQCSQSDIDSHACHLAYKTTTELVCENGGTPNGTKCFCPLPFAGRLCQRYMRDCTEGYENGHQDRHKGAYLIQPMTSPAPFLVKCEFDWGGMTFPLWRQVSGTSWSAVTWEQAKVGFGDDLNVEPDSKNFFVGLEKLHQILSQGLNNNQILSSYGNPWTNSGAYYHNFTVASEPTKYQLSYDNFYDYPRQPSLNGLDVSSGPVVFAAPGNDPNSCAETRGAPGWYGSNCSGHSMFADPPTWPVPGQGSPDLKEVLFVLVRTEPFWEE